MSSDAFGFVVVAAVSSYVLTAACRVIAPRLGFLDHPDSRRKAHPRPTPLLGGVAVYLSFVIAILYAFHRGWSGLDADSGIFRVMVMLPITGAIFCLIGLWDDKRPLSARKKLLLQTAACVPFVLWGRSIESVQVLSMHFQLGLFGAAFTVFWLVACANIINLVDGLDGLAGTVGLIGCAAVALMSHMQGLPGATALGLIFSGCLIGFLLHNWPPAKIFLGDSGSLLIGFVIGALAIESSIKRATTFTLSVPLVLVSVPVFDTLMAIVRRKLTGRGIAEADRGHIHHCLQNRGLSGRQSLLAISALCLAMAAATVASVYFQNDFIALAFCAALLAMLVTGRIFGYDETMLFFRYQSLIANLLLDTSGLLRTRLLLARMDRSEAESPDACWNEITDLVQNMGGRLLDFAYVNEQTDEVLFRLCWESDGPPRNNTAEWQFRYSVPGERDIRAELVASGHSGRRVNGRRIVDLFRVFDTFCRRWFLLNAVTLHANLNIAPNLDSTHDFDAPPQPTDFPVETSETRKAA